MSPEDLEEESDGSMDMRRPDHLPNLRPDGQARDPMWLPRQRRGTTPQMIGRYPDYDVMESASLWDDATRRVVESRLDRSRTLTFFSGGEQACARRFCDLVMAQDREPRIPVMELIDEKMAKGLLDGFHFEDMPDDRVTWHQVLSGLDETSKERSGESFSECDAQLAHSIVNDFAHGRLEGEDWKGINVVRAWAVCTRGIFAAFYSHPWAWNEIGFGGPAYPRGYMRLGPLSVLDPHESPGATSEDPVRATEGLDE
jgi:Gluconate 2-dehydrogenase subunit 3